MTGTEKVAEFAANVHSLQLKKYTNEPYFIHLRDVANMVEPLESEYPYIVEVAYLHDSLEDQINIDALRIGLKKCGYSFDEIQLITDYVRELTDEFTIDNYPTFNRPLRKLMEAERLGKTSKLAQTVKYADIIVNTSSIVDLAPKFAKTYLREKEEYLKQMTVGDKKLRNKALSIVRKYK